MTTASTTSASRVASFVGLSGRERLRERIHLGIALHVAVNLGFALSATMGGMPVGEASALAVAPDPSPALDRAVAVYAVEHSFSSVAAPTSAGSATVRRARVSAGSARSGVDDGLDRFDRLAMCESGGDPTAVSPSGRYRGAFQFSRPTWEAAGGEGDPVDVSYSEQKRIAMRWAEVVAPSAQWPVCWPRTA